MTDAERQRLIEILQRGELPPLDLAPVLFPDQNFPAQKREAELTYLGKAREADILAEAMAVPLQCTRRFGKNGDDWHNMLIFGDNLQAMKSLLEMKKQGKLCNADGTPGIRLVYIDPPFSTKREMQGQDGVQAYQDKVAAAEFLEFIRKRLVLIRELLSDDGSVYVHLDWRMNSYVRVLMDEIFGKENLLNEIIWCYTRMATKGQRQFSRAADTVLWYSRSDTWTFNVDDIRQPYSPSSKAREGYTLNKLGSGISKEGKTVLNPIGKFPENWITDIPYLRGNERVDYPTHKPETLC